MNYITNIITGFKRKFATNPTHPPSTVKVPSMPIELVAAQGGEESRPRIVRGKLMLWAFLSALSDVCKNTGKDRTMPINALYDHFLAFCGVASSDVTRKQFGNELHRWIRDGHLSLLPTKPRSAAAHVEGIDLATLELTFQN